MIPDQEVRVTVHTDATFPGCIESVRTGKIMDVIFDHDVVEPDILLLDVDMGKSHRVFHYDLQASGIQIEDVQTGTVIHNTRTRNQP